MKKWVMINYDLGLKGDYQNLYRFLDNNNALDCGNCNSALEIEVSKDDFDTIFDEVTSMIKKNFEFSQNDRIYLTVTDSTNQMRGRFICGNRKRAIWEGYGDISPTEYDVF